MLPAVPSGSSALFEFPKLAAQIALQIFVIDHHDDPLGAGNGLRPVTPDDLNVAIGQLLDSGHVLKTSDLASSIRGSISTTSPPATAWIRPACRAFRAKSINRGWVASSTCAQADPSILLPAKPWTDPSQNASAAGPMVGETRWRTFRTRPVRCPDWVQELPASRATLSSTDSFSRPSVPT